LREQMMKLRFQQSTGQIENPQILSSLRRDLARAMTILREREIKKTTTGTTTAAGGGDS
jgi:large subunit ribosomal protein L29